MGSLTVSISIYYKEVTKSDLLFYYITITHYMPKHYKYLQNPEDTPSNPLTWDRLMAWLADTGYIEGLVGKRISPLDRHLIEDYIQEVWVQILEVPHDKLLEIWYKGKGRFTNYLKSIVINNVYSNSSHLYKNIREGTHELIHLDDTGWKMLENDNEAEAYLTFPSIERERGKSSKATVKIEEEKIYVRSENKLYE